MEFRVADWGANRHALVIWKNGLAKGIFAVALLKDPFVIYCFGDEET